MDTNSAGEVGQAPASPTRPLARRAPSLSLKEPPSAIACRSEKQQKEEKWKIEFQAWKEEQGLADDAKVFVICPPGGYIDVREALESRGWVENMDPESEFFHFKYTVKAKDLKNPMPLDHQQLNHFFNGGCLTTKTGITAWMDQLHWHKDIHHDDIFPRSYNLANASELEAWETDFKWTAAEAILRRVQADGGLHPAGVPLGAEFAVVCALKVAEAHLRHLTYLKEGEEEEEKEGGAWCPPLPEKMSEVEWDTILNCSYFDFHLSEAENISKETEVSPEDGDGDGDADDEESDGEGDADALESLDAPGGEAASCGGSSSPEGADGSSATPRSSSDAEEAHASPSEGGEQETQAARQQRFKGVSAVPLREGLGERVDGVLEGLSARCRQFRTDGCSNIWILKPGGKSRGRGIRCINKLSAVTQLLRKSHNRRRLGRRDRGWVVQKYVENPLIVHGRKFDIRQWVLVTDWNPLTIWFYDSCYLRFAAEDYSLANIDNKFSHLTNNSIAAKSGSFETDEIGEGNMWHCEEFVDWLVSDRGQPHAFEETIQPAMRRAVECSLSCVQEKMSHRRGTHELFGYDFIVDEDLGTWMIEVNCSPCLQHSTPVTGRLVSSMVEDLVKVVVDLPEAKRTAKRGEFDAKEFNTGLFKCISGAPLPGTSASRQPHIIATPLVLQANKMKIRRRRVKPLAALAEAKQPEPSSQGAKQQEEPAAVQAEAPPTRSMSAAETLTLPLAMTTEFDFDRSLFCGKQSFFLNGGELGSRRRELSHLRASIGAPVYAGMLEGDGPDTGRSSPALDFDPLLFPKRQRQNLPQLPSAPQAGAADGSTEGEESPRAGLSASRQVSASGGGESPRGDDIRAETSRMISSSFSSPTCGRRPSTSYADRVLRRAVLAVDEEHERSQARRVSGSRPLLKYQGIALEPIQMDIPLTRPYSPVPEVCTTAVRSVNPSRSFSPIPFAMRIQGAVNAPSAEPTTELYTPFLDLVNARRISTNMPTAAGTAAVYLPEKFCTKLPDNRLDLVRRSWEAADVSSPVKRVQPVDGNRGSPPPRTWRAPAYEQPVAAPMSSAEEQELARRRTVAQQCKAQALPSSTATALSTMPRQSPGTGLLVATRHQERLRRVKKRLMALHTGPAHTPSLLHGSSAEIGTMPRAASRPKYCSQDRSDSEDGVVCATKPSGLFRVLSEARYKANVA